MASARARGGWIWSVMMPHDYDSLSYHSAAGASEARSEEHGATPCDMCDEPHPCECDPLDLWDSGSDYDPIHGFVPDAFADPGGRSALRAAGPGNPRNIHCPTCGEPNRLTPRDRALGYQCDHCADQAERGGP